MVLYFSCVNLLVRCRWWYASFQSRIPNLLSFSYRLLLGSATLQFIILTIHIAAIMRSMREGFIWLKNPTGAVLYWESQARLVKVLKEAATITNVGFSYIIESHCHDSDVHIVSCVRHHNTLEIIRNLEKGA